MQSTSLCSSDNDALALIYGQTLFIKHAFLPVIDVVLLHIDFDMQCL